jgi:hypothetical protein
MVWFRVWQVVSTLNELIRLGRRSESAKDFEILLLRHKLAIYERGQERAPHLSWGENLTLVVLATKVKDKTNRTIKTMGDKIGSRETAKIPSLSITSHHQSDQESQRCAVRSQPHAIHQAILLRPVPPDIMMRLNKDLMKELKKAKWCLFHEHTLLRFSLCC